MALTIAHLALGGGNKEDGEQRGCPPSTPFVPNAEGEP